MHEHEPILDHRVMGCQTIMFNIFTRLTLFTIGCGLPLPQAIAQSGMVDPTRTICNSSAASLSSLQEDPLLRRFFEQTCGKSLESVLGQPAPTNLPAPANPVKSDANEPVVASPRPKPPEIKLDPVVTAPPKAPSLEVPAPAQATQPLVFSQIELDGVHFGSSRALKDALSGFIGKPITLESLDQVNQTIQTWYRAQGFLARTTLPSQDLSDGKLLVNIVESQFSGTRINDPKGLLRNTQVPKGLVESHQAPGDAVDLNQLEKAAASLRDLSGVETSVLLSPGARTGETTAVVNIGEGKPFEIQVNADNHGSRGTGENRVSTQFNFNNLTLRGDTLSGSLLKSDGLDYGALSYTLPFTASGWQVQARTSHSSYHLTDGNFSAADLRGPSSSYGLGLGIPFVRDGRNSVSFQFGIDKNEFENRALGNIVSKYNSLIANAQLDGQHMDMSGRGQSVWAVQFARGELDLSDSPSFFQLTDDLGPRTAGYFNKARVSASRRDSVSAGSTLTIRAQGQWADKNLDGSERFYLGGARGVRAYPANEAGGSLGHLASIEWESHLYSNPYAKWAIATFYDYGRIKRLKTELPPGVDPNPIRNSYSLEGYGIWLGSQSRTVGGGSLGFRVTFARRAGNNPGALNNGLDSDGTKDLNRILLDANLAF